ncbi:hypothetical protein IYW40_15740 [Methylocystis sp. H4A]|nr:hypothetical protein [Methylocystis sp. H4A]
MLSIPKTARKRFGLIKKRLGAAFHELARRRDPPHQNVHKRSGGSFSHRLQPVRSKFVAMVIAICRGRNCSNRKILYLDEIEKAVLTGLQQHLKAPNLLKEFVRTYQEERERLAADKVR